MNTKNTQSSSLFWLGLPQMCFPFQFLPRNKIKKIRRLDMLGIVVTIANVIVINDQHNTRNLLRVSCNPDSRIGVSGCLKSAPQIFRGNLFHENILYICTETYCELPFEPTETKIAPCARAKKKDISGRRFRGLHIKVARNSVFSPCNYYSA